MARTFTPEQGFQMRDQNTPLDGETGAIESFLRHRLDLSDKTRVLYRRILRRAAVWMQTSGVDAIAGNVTLDVVEQFIEARCTVVKLSSARCDAIVLKSFGQYLGRRVIHGPSPLAGLRLPKPPETTKRAISDEELARLVAAAKRGRNGTRDLAIVRVAAGCGLRLSEITALRMGDIDWTEGQLIVRGETSKSMRTRRATLWPEVASAIDDYITDRDGPDDAAAPLFLARGGTGLRSQGLAAIFRQLAVEAHISDLTAHLLRHAWSTNYLRKECGDIIDMSREAGWHDKQNRMAWRYSHEKPIAERRLRRSPFANVVNPASAVIYRPRFMKRRVG